MECPFCVTSRNDPIWQDAHCRVITSDDPSYPSYYRVVWKEHVAEMSDLDAHARRHFMDVVFAVESALRALINPDKINLASLGNRVPHLHWHVIARFTDDPHFPESIWGSERRRGPAHDAPDPAILAIRIAAELARIPVT